MIQHLSKLMAEKSGVRGASFAQQFRKAPRVFPRRLRSHARLIAEAEGLVENPKLARRLDLEALGAAYDKLLEYFEKTSVPERRKTAVLRWLGGLVINLFVLGLVILAVIAITRQS